MIAWDFQTSCRQSGLLGSALVAFVRQVCRISSSEAEGKYDGIRLRLMCTAWVDLQFLYPFFMWSLKKGYEQVTSDKENCYP